MLEQSLKVISLDNPHRVLIVAQSGEVLAQVTSCASGADAAARAHKLAAAPELYAALVAVQWGNYDNGRERCPDCGSTSDAGHQESCSVAAALAKAEGRENSDGSQ